MGIGDYDIREPEIDTKWHSACDIVSDYSKKDTILLYTRLADHNTIPCEHDFETGELVIPPMDELQELLIEYVYECISQGEEV